MSLRLQMLIILLQQEPCVDMGQGIAAGDGIDSTVGENEDIGRFLGPWCGPQGSVQF